MANPYNTLPPQAFDGQIFIDAFRVKWEFDGSTGTWLKIGSCTDILPATEFNTGLLTARLKQLLDGIPAGGGHFGIIAQPLLSLVNQNPNILNKDQVQNAILTESGTEIVGKGVEDRDHVPEQFVGKILIFKTGLLTKRAFLIFTNDETTIFLEGDASAASREDQYEIVESTELNPSGVLLGDILLVSDTIDITCVDGDGLPLAGGASCNLDFIHCDEVNNPPGLNLQLNQDFLDSLCITIPGCKGPTGVRGYKGAVGLDGTGDGPEGEQGDPGDNAPEIGNTFSGIRIIDVDDIFDTAVVSMELDADSGKLSIVRAKVKTPDNETPATQLISTPIDRAISFTDDNSFAYELKAPSVDPVGEADVDILKYPQKFDRAGQNTDVGRVKLSDVMNAVISFYEGKLAEINDEYNQQLKLYVESKDEAARHILANLAMQVAECEFELPIDFCLGIHPDECHNTHGSLQSVPFEFPFAQLLFGGTGDITATSLGTYDIPAATGVPDGESFLDLKEISSNHLPPDIISYVSVQFPNNISQASTVTLPPGGYVVQYVGGSLRSSGTDWLVGSTSWGHGLIAIVQEEGEAATAYNMPVPTSSFNTLERSSVELAYKEAPITERVISIEVIKPATIRLFAPLPGTKAQGSIQVNVIRVLL